MPDVALPYGEASQSLWIFGKAVKLWSYRVLGLDRDVNVVLRNFHHNRILCIMMDKTMTQ